MTGFRLYWDLDGDGDYTGSYEEITDDVMEMAWSLGLKKWADMANESILTAKLKNTEGIYNPENTSSPLYGLIKPYIPILLTDSDGNSLWKGWLDKLDIQWEPGGESHGEMPMSLKASGAKRLLQEAPIVLDLQEDKRGDEIIEVILGQVALGPAALGGWILGLAGFSELGVNTYLGDAAEYSDLDYGSLLFNNYGDKLPPNAYQAIDEITKAERGRFFFDRSGRAVWWNRYHLLDTGVDELTIDSYGMLAANLLNYEWGASIINRVEVTVYPRTAGGSITLWSLNEPVTIPGNGTVEFEAPYNDSVSQKAGAVSIAATGTTFSEGSGVVSLSERGDRAVVSVQNSGSTEAVLSALSITGQPVTQHNTLVARYYDEASRVAYGWRDMKLNLKALESLDAALDVARFIVRFRKDLQGEVNGLILKNETANDANASQLAMPIGTRISVTLPEMGHEKSYYVIGEHHKAWDGLMVHQVTLELEPATLTRLSHHYNHHYDSDVNLEYDDPERTRLAQGFEVSASQTVTIVRLWLRKVGTPTGDLTLTIYNNHLTGGSWYLGVPGSSELEVTTILASDTEYPDALITNGTSDTVSATELSTAYDWIEFSFPTPPSLTAGSKYWLVLSTSDSASGLDYVQWGADSSDPDYRERFLFGRWAGIWDNLDRIACYQLLNSQSDVVSQFGSGYQDDAGQLNALAAGGATVIDNAGTNLSLIGDSAGNDQWVAQSFISSFAGNLSELQIRFGANLGGVGEVIWQIRTDSSGNPSSTILDSGIFTPVSNAVNSIAVSDGVFLNATNTYWLVLRSEIPQAAGDAYRVNRNATSVYANGSMKATVNGGSSWSAVGTSDMRATIILSATSTRDKLAQGVRLDGVSKIAMLKLWLRKIGSPTGTLTAKLCRDDNNQPGVVMATADTVAASSLGSSYGWISFTFDTPPTLATDQLYWIVIETTDPESASSFVEWGAAWGQTSYPGWMLAEKDGWFQLENKDAIFEVYH